MLRETQGRFVAALRDSTLPPPDGVAGRGDEVPERRFAVYRNNVFVSLVEALAGTFPVTAKLVGEEFFRAMARVFAGLELPRTPVLLDYGENFPSFIDGFGPAASLPYLGDVARLEWAWTRAYHAREATPLALAAMASVPPERVADLVLHLHPSLRLVCSRFPVLAIWQANTAETAARVDLGAGGEDVLVVRPRESVTLRTLPSGGAAFLGAVAGGAPLGRAFERAVAIAGDFDLQGNLAGLFEAGGVTGYRFEDAGAGAGAAAETAEMAT